MLWLHLVTVDSNDDMVDYDELVGTYEMSAVIEDDFDSGTNPYCKTVDGLINAANEWEASGSADIAAGEFSIPLDAYNTDFNSKIGTSAADKNVMFELQLRDSTDSDLPIIAVFSFPFICYNIMDRSGAVPTTGAEADEYKGKLSSDPVSPDDGDFYYNTTDHVWRYYIVNEWTSLPLQPD